MTFEPPRPRFAAHSWWALLLMLAVTAGPVLAYQEAGQDQDAARDASSAEGAEGEIPKVADTSEGDGDSPKVADTSGADTSEEEEDPNRVSVTLPLEAGGTATARAASLEFVRDDFAVLEGDVVLLYEDYELSAQRVEMDLATRDVTAAGRVVLDQGPRRLTGETLELNLDTELGRLTEATAYVDPDYYFSGTEILKVGDDVYEVTDGVFTSCEGETPAWSFRLGQARVEVEGYARVKNAAFRVKDVPVLYSPYILWPTKQERTSGFLVPNVGYSERRGAYLGMAYYQVLGRSYDTTFFFDGYSEGFVGLGNEFRYRPSEGTEGVFEGYAVYDEEESDWRWKVDLEHETRDLPFGMRGVIDLTEYSDFQFFQDFERDFDRNSRRFQESRAFASGSWGPHLVNVLATNRETFTATRINEDRRLPELEYRLRQTPLFGNSLPFYLTVDSSLAYLSVDRSDTYDASYGRVDVFPELSVPLEPFPWLSFTLTAGQRLTWWGDSLETDPEVVTATGDSFTGESLTRTFPVVGAEVIGPSVSKVFDVDMGGYGKLKHVIEPKVVYSYVDEYDDQSLVPSFDEVDRRFSGHTVRYSLTNRVKAKPKEPEEEDGLEDGAPEGEEPDVLKAGEEGVEEIGLDEDESEDEQEPQEPTPVLSVQEVFSFELAQTYSLDDMQPLISGVDEDGERIESQQGPLEAVLRFDPSQRFSLRAEGFYDTLFNRVSAAALTGTYRRGRNDFGLRLATRYRPSDGETLSNQLRFNAGVALVPRVLQLRASVNYDLERDLLQEQRYFLDYTGSCYSIRLEFRDFQAGETRDTDYRVAFTLKNVGTFLDLTGRIE